MHNDTLRFEILWEAVPSALTSCGIHCHTHTPRQQSLTRSYLPQSEISPQTFELLESQLPRPVSLGTRWVKEKHGYSQINYICTFSNVWVERVCRIKQVTSNCASQSIYIYALIYICRITQVWEVKTTIQGVQFVCPRSQWNCALKTCVCSTAVYIKTLLCFHST